VKHVNTRFPDDLYDEVAAAAVAQERPIGAWLRIAAKEKLARGRDDPDFHVRLVEPRRVAEFAEDYDPPRLHRG
jgi:hypothetical protein